MDRLMSGQIKRSSVQRTIQLISSDMTSLINLIPKIGEKWSQHSPSAKYRAPFSANKQIWAIKVYFQWFNVSMFPTIKIMFLHSLNNHF